MEPNMIPEDPKPAKSDRLIDYLRSLGAFFADRRVSISGLLMFAYAAGIVSAFYIRDSHPVAIVHPGPYALVAIYKGEVYELIPMEDSVRLRELESGKLEPKIQKVGQLEPKRTDSLPPKKNKHSMDPDKGRY